MPQFLVVAYDSRDEGVSARRAATRPAHLEGLRPLMDNNQILIGAVILDDDGKVIGSTQFLDMPSRADVDAYIAQDPYTKQKVWERVEVMPVRIGVRDGKVLF